MKKHLLSTSAIALGVAMAAPAAAQEWDVSFGGFMNQHVAYRDLSGTEVSGGGFDGVDFHSNTEIIFSPSITLDNGLTFGAHVQLEGENQGNSQIDETYMTISGDTLGKIEVGSTNSAGYKLMVGAPGVTTMYINSPSISTFIPWSAVSHGGFGVHHLRQAGLSSYTEVAGNNDVQRLSYYTPSFNGLTLGVSYAPTGSVNAANNYGVAPNSTVHDIFDIGANYSQTFGTTSVTLAARYGTGEAPSGVAMSDPETWGIGAQVGFGAITIGASYAENDNGLANGATDSTGWSLGATYDAVGPWSFEALTYQGETKNMSGNKGDYEAYRIGASRDLGPGVDWDIYIAHVEADNGEVGGGYQNVEGTLIGTGINLSF